MASCRWGWRVAAPIMLIGAALRLAAPGAVPPGLHPDEASTALEARSLWERGASSDGRAWPLTVRMHGRYWAEATYVWLAAPCSALPLEVETWVRLPAAAAGLVLLPLGFLLARRLLPPRAALYALLLLALEPQAWHYGRLALRATLVPPLIVGGLVLLLGLAERRGRSGWLGGASAGLLFSLAALTYTPARLVVPVFALGLFALLRRSSGSRRPRLLALGLPCLIALAAIPWSFTAEGGARVQAVAVWSQAEGPLHGLWLFLRGYALQFSPRLLFWGSSSKGFWAEGVAPLLAVEVPLVLMGLGVVGLRAWRGERVARLLLLWLLVHPLAAALTVPAPNPLRAIVGLPLWALLGAQGARSLWALARRRLARTGRSLFVGAAGLGLVVSAALGAYSYFVRFPAREGRFWYAKQNAALETLLGDARRQGAQVQIDVGWLEVALVRARAERPVQVLKEEEGREVLLVGEGAALWSALMSPSELIVRRPEGEERFPLD